MRSNIDIKMIISIILLIFVITTIVFIFSNSLASKQTSAETSGNLLETVKPVVDPVIKPIVGEEGLTHTLLRKTAHFLEFGLLGTFVMLYVIVNNMVKIKNFLSIAGFGLFIALCDETLQIFTNRGSQVSDVWIDFFGYFVAMIGFATIYLICNYIMVAKRQI